MFEYLFHSPFSILSALVENDRIVSVFYLSFCITKFPFFLNNLRFTSVHQYLLEVVPSVFLFFSPLQYFFWYLPPFHRYSPISIPGDVRFVMLLRYFSTQPSQSFPPPAFAVSSLSSSSITFLTPTCLKAFFHPSDHFQARIL